MKLAVISQENVMTGISIMATLVQCRLKYALGKETPTLKTCKLVMTRLVSIVTTSSQLHPRGFITFKHRGPKMIPTAVARGGSERKKRFRMTLERKA